MHLHAHHIISLHFVNEDMAVTSVLWTLNFKYGIKSNIQSEVIAIFQVDDIFQFCDWWSRNISHMEGPLFQTNSIPEVGSRQCFENVENNIIECINCHKSCMT